MFHKVKHCYGITLWSYKKRLEVWFCFGGVDAHTHPEQDVTIVPLLGRAIFVRDNKTKRITWREWFHSFDIPAGVSHWFAGKFLVFLNITNGNSASENLHWT